MGSECGAKFVRAGAPRSLRDDGETSVLINQSINQSIAAFSVVVDVCSGFAPDPVVDANGGLSFWFGLSRV